MFCCVVEVCSNHAMPSGAVLKCEVQCQSHTLIQNWKQLQDVYGTNGMSKKSDSGCATAEVDMESGRM